MPALPQAMAAQEAASQSRFDEHAKRKESSKDPPWFQGLRRASQRGPLQSLSNSHALASESDGLRHGAHHAFAKAGGRDAKCEVETQSAGAAMQFGLFGRVPPASPSKTSR